MATKTINLATEEFVLDSLNKSIINIDEIDAIFMEVFKEELEEIEEN